MQVKFKPEKSMFKELVLDASDKEDSEEEDSEEEPFKLDYNRFNLY